LEQRAREDISLSIREGAAHGDEAGMFFCNDCHDKFTVRTGTTF
jgi:hypothetical protein